MHTWWGRTGSWHCEQNEILAFFMWWWDLLWSLLDFDVFFFGTGIKYSYYFWWLDVLCLDEHEHSVMFKLHPQKGQIPLHSVLQMVFKGILRISCSLIIWSGSKKLSLIKSRSRSSSASSISASPLNGIIDRYSLKFFDKSQAYGSRHRSHLKRRVTEK